MLLKGDSIMDQVSQGEIVRLSLLETLLLSNRVLMAAKLPARCTEEATKMIQWSEINNKSGLKHLHDQLENLSFSEMELVEVNNSKAIINANNSSVLISGPPALDLACAKAVNNEIGVVSVKNISNIYPFSDYLSIKAAHRGFIGLLIYPWLDTNKNNNHNEINYHTKLTIPNDNGKTIIERSSTIAPKVLADVFLNKDICTSNLSKDQILTILGNAFVNNVEDSVEILPGELLLICIKKDFMEKEIIENIKSIFEKSPDNKSQNIYYPKEILTQQEKVTKEGLMIDRVVWDKLVEFGDQILVKES